MKKVYIIRNTSNTKVYIGQTSAALEHRFAQHKSDAKHGSTYALHKAMREIGSENFKIEVLEKDIPDENAADREKHWIKFLDSVVPNGYNMNGEYYSRAIFSPEEIRKVKQDIKETALTFNELGKKYKVRPAVISEINCGYVYKDATEVYPLRPDNSYPKDLVKQLQYQLKYELSKGIMAIAEEYGVDYTRLLDINYGRAYRLPGNSYPLRENGNTLKRTISEETYCEVVRLLKETKLPHSEIGKLTGISGSYVSAINLGKYRFNENQGIQFPIRESTKVKIILSAGQLNEIVGLLRDTELSMSEIGKKFGVTSQLIRNINSGKVKRYFDPNIVYPIRKLKICID